MREIWSSFDRSLVYSPCCKEDVTDHFSITSALIMQSAYEDGIGRVTFETCAIDSLIEALVDFRYQMSAELAKLENDPEK